MLSEYAKAVVKALLEPTREQQTIVVAPYQHAVFTVFLTAKEEHWNWRRTKRECRRIGLARKGVRREYHKQAAYG